MSEQHIVFPEEAGAALNRLVQLHPGKDKTTVVIRAMTAYHCLYEMYLEDAACPCIRALIDHLDQQDEERGLKGG